MVWNNKKQLLISHLVDLNCAMKEYGRLYGNNKQDKKYS